MSCQRIVFLSKELINKGFIGRGSGRLKDVAIAQQRYPAPTIDMGKGSLFWRVLLTVRLKAVCVKMNETLNVMAVLFGKQCNALAAQRIRRAAQILDLYTQLYDPHSIRLLMQRLSTQLIRTQRTKPLIALFGAVLFSWDHNAITEEEVKSCVGEILSVKVDSVSSVEGKPARRLPQFGENWEQIINREKIVVWRKPVPETHLYEYKVYGTFHDIPARAFFNIQVDLDYRKQWDHLIIKANVVDKDKSSGCEVVQWISHFPYPMYSREYVFVRKVRIDTQKQIMVLMSQSVEHPKCPVRKDFVRVQNYKSHLVLKPHTAIDENGFDYILSYCDDPQASIPSVAYKWMASTGVPDFCEKMHTVAKQYQEKSQRSSQVEVESERAGNFQRGKQKIAV